MNNFVHQLADVQSPSIGEGTRVWQFCVVLPKAVIGRECNICAHVLIENDVRIGDNVTVKSGVQVWDGITLEDNVFIGPNVAFTNDLHPRSKVYPEQFARTIVRRNASIGANATILPGIEIGEQAMIGAGAVVTRSVPDYAIVVGNPATIIGYTNTNVPTPERAGDTASGDPVATESMVPGVELLTLRMAADMRGKLAVGQVGDGLPFVPQRMFMVYDVPSRETRGEHAHRECHQLLMCVHGQCVAVADDGRKRQEFLLDASHKALYMPPRIWGTQYRYSEDAVLVVLASHAYDPADYVRDYREFLTMVEAGAW
ncbi:WxcM-like domain-containing protein [Sphingomonas sp. TZW2008]|uniref:WxcM-like domain-containing protein n=1 Tax=Sphingomonas sp. TZW2008 TaxID=1917973 RepID=UPI000A269976|nr:WxcM-like domain-containing protein [Sphingomonas sp. TZW2008]